TATWSSSATTNDDALAHGGRCGSESLIRCGCGGAEEIGALPRAQEAGAEVLKGAREKIGQEGVSKEQFRWRQASGRGSTRRRATASSPVRTAPTCSSTTQRFRCLATAPLKRVSASSSTSARARRVRKLRTSGSSDPHAYPFSSARRQPRRRSARQIPYRA